MDISKSNKPMHFKCPKCGNDISINGHRVKADYDNAKRQLHILNAKIEKEKKMHGKSKYLKHLKQKQREQIVEVQEKKQAWSSLSNLSESHVFIIFKKKLKEKYGHDEINKMLEEAEDELFYRTSDMMKQKYTNFEGA